VPSPGRITGLNLPGGDRYSRGYAAYQDGVIPPYYDSLVAKLIAHGKRSGGSDSADETGARFMFVVEGIHTSIPLHQTDPGASGFYRGA
jgi:acetyl-CoA carboxylase biotin carboxylase subunit